MSHNFFYSLISGEKTDKTFLKGIIPNKVYEQVYDCDQYYSVVCVYPRRERVLGFEAMYREIRKIYESLVLPAFYLCEKGVNGSYFVIYLKK